MNKEKLYKLIFIIAVYSMAFTLLLISIKSYTKYLDIYKNTKLTQHADTISTNSSKKANFINITHIKNNIFNNEAIRKNPYKSTIPKEKSIQKKIADSVLRLHIIANSNSDTDQQLKLKVRDSILHELQTGLSDITSTAQAKQYVASKFVNIKNTADYTIRQNGYSYSSKVFIQNRYFPTKVYGDLTFPAGYYDALCIEIGKSAGHNWWCVLFPSLCFENETTATVPDDSKQKLRDSLTKKEYRSLEQPKNNITNKQKNNTEAKKIQVRSGFYDLFTSISSK